MKVALSLSVVTLAACLIGCDNSETTAPPPPSGAGFSQPMNQAQPMGQPTLPPELQALYEQGQALQTQLDSITMRLGTAQEKAMQVDRIVEMRENLEAAAETEMLKTNPELKAAIDRLPELVGLLESNEEVNTTAPENYSEATKALITEYESLTAAIQPVQAKVAALPEIETAREALFAAMQEESIKLEPEFEKLEQEYEQLSSQLNELGQQFNAAQQQLQAQSQPAPAAIGSAPAAAPTAPATPAGANAATGE